jgi:hydrogenase maturation protease
MRDERLDTAHTSTIVVLGIGNVLLSDEGVGVHALRALERARDCPPDTQFIDGGTLSFSLAAHVQSCDRLVVFDAAELGEAAGAVRVFEDNAMDEFLSGNRKRTVHEVGLLDLMAIAALSGALPGHRALVCIQPQSFAWSDTPTARVAQAIPDACAKALELLERWRQ